MTVQEALATPEVRAQYEQLVSSPEARAAGIAAHWQQYNDGLEDSFFAYFMLEAHEAERKAFLAEIEASDQIPYPNGVPQAMLKTGRAILWAAAQGYEDGDPYAVYYTGSRVQPIE